jgi:hypothetical protein
VPSASRAPPSPPSSVLLLRARPAAGSSAQEIADFYLERDSGRVALVGLYLAPFAGIAFLWFIAAIRSQIGEREDRLFATVFLGSGLLFVVMLFATSAAAGALLAAVRFQDQPPPGADTVMFARALAFASSSFSESAPQPSSCSLYRPSGCEPASCLAGSCSPATPPGSSSSSRLRRCDSAGETAYDSPSRANSATQFVSQVSPPSSENACSQRGLGVFTADQV